MAKKEEEEKVQHNQLLLPYPKNLSVSFFFFYSKLPQELLLLATIGIAVFMSVSSLIAPQRIIHHCYSYSICCLVPKSQAKS